MLFLFIASLLLLAVVMLQRKILPNITFRNMKMWQVFLLVIFPILFFYILNFGGKSIGESFAMVALGYYVFSEDEIIKKLEKFSLLFLIITIVTCCIYVYIFVWMGNHDAFICEVLHETAKWCGVLGWIGFGKKYLEKDNKVTRFLSMRSFPIYIFHFGWIVLIQYYLSKLTSNTICIYFITVAGTLAGIFLTVEIVRRTPVIRVLFGMQKSGG